MGNGLRRLRRMLDLEQKDVASRLEMTPQAYSHWENGRTELRVSDLVRLSYLGLRVPLGTLMRFMELPIEDRVLSPGQWVDSGAPAPAPSGTIPASASGTASTLADGNAASGGAKRQLPRAKAALAAA